MRGRQTGAHAKEVGDARPWPFRERSDGSHEPAAVDPQPVRVNNPATRSERTDGLSVNFRQTRVCALRRTVRDGARALGTEARCQAVAVEEVVHRLEEQAQLLAERSPRRLSGLGHVGRPQPEPDRRGEEAPGLQPVEIREVGVVAGDVAVLAADHPERRLDELARGLRTLVREHEPERLREQRVAREERDPLAERDVRARTTAPLVVVVQRGQVVVDEREGVHELDGGRAGERVLDRAAGRLGDGETEDRPDPLAARLEA